MKIRTDFVTNSSSSSFIIGKQNEGITKDFVFGVIKEFYKEYLAKKEAFLLHCHEYKMHYDETHGCFDFDTGKKWDDANEVIDNLVQEQYGLTSWDYFPSNLEWLDFETYQDYEDYWLKVLKGEIVPKDKSTHAPFSIVDYVNDKGYYPIQHSRSYGLKYVNAPFCADRSGVFGWYIACGHNMLGKDNMTEDTTYCGYCSFELGDSNCKTLKEGVKSGKITNENAIAMILGTVCIHSECGYIPDFVVNKLGEISNYWCNHMG